MTAPLIELNGVTRRYDDGPPALDDVSLAVATGEAVAVLGPSGSGKSTLLNLVAGLDRPTAGTVTVGGSRIDTLGEAASAKYRRATIGLVFQFFNLLDDLTVLDNVVLPAQLAGAARGETTRRATELLRTLGIDRHAGAYPGRLSGGERQRVAVARALMNRPALLLADEPTGALDTASGADVRRLLTDLHADGQTMLLVTHDRTLADECATRTIEVVDGRIASDTALDRLARCDERAEPGRPLRGEPPLGADRRDHAGHRRRRHLGCPGDRPAGGVERALRPRLRRPARGAPDGADGPREGHDRAAGCHRRGRRRRRGLRPVRGGAGHGAPGAATGVERAAPGRSWPRPDRRRPDGSGNRCRPGDPDRGTLGGAAR